MTQRNMGFCIPLFSLSPCLCVSVVMFRFVFCNIVPETRPVVYPFKVRVICGSSFSLPKVAERGMIHAGIAIC